MKADGGFSLIEFLVAMTLGVLIIGGLGGVYVSGKRNWNLDRAMGTTQTNGHFLISQLRQFGWEAGFMQEPWKSPETVFPADPPYFAAGQTIAIQADALPGLDRLLFRRQTRPGTAQANACGLTLAGPPDDVFVIDLVPQAAPTPSACGAPANVRVICRLASAAGPGPETILAEGVDALKVLVGVDDDNDAVADRFVASAAATADDLAGAVSLRIGAIVNSVVPAFTAATPSTFNLFGVNYNFNDRCRRWALETSVTLRNRVP